MTSPLPWSITLPTPPSVNALYVNRVSAGKKGRMISPAYKAWKIEADAVLWQNLPLPHFLGRVAIFLAAGKTNGLSDIDGRIKAPLDWLVNHTIIVDDNSKYVRMVLAAWSDDIPSGSCKVTVSPL